MILEFEDILKQNNGGIFDTTPKGHMKRRGTEFPLSVKQAEFEFIRDLIISRNLKSGFEVATGVGVSGWAAGSGFSETGGRLVSMDAYIEEHFGDPVAYQHEKPLINHDSPSFKEIKQITQELGLGDYITHIAGWSPDDIPTDRKLDYAFIDSGHFPELTIKEIRKISSLMTEGVILLHDFYDEQIGQETIDFIKNDLGAEIEVMIPYPYGENLAMIEIKPRTI